jgi:hypothetical protein
MGKESMRNKIIGIFVCMLLISIILPMKVIAGDENDPEIRDNLNDLWGPLVDHPTRVRSQIALVLLQINSFDFIDINSAWFYENISESGYLYAALKLNDLSVNPQRAIYTIHWKCNGVPYTVWSHLYNNGQNCISFVGVDSRFNHRWHNVEVTYDINRSIVTFKMDKKYIGVPKSGDLLIRTFAWTALRFNFEPFTLLFSKGELVLDAAPFIENNTEYGRNYQIMY